MTLLSQIILSWSIAITSVACQEAPIPIIEVRRQSVTARSGPAQFTVLGDTAIPISCAFYDFVRTNVSFLSDGNVVQTAQSEGHGIFQNFTYKGKSVGNYSCRLQIPSDIRSNLTFSYTMESRIEVTRRNSSLNCLSPVGDYGMFGEMVKLRCQGDGLQWHSKKGPYINIRLTTLTGFMDSQYCENRTYLKAHQGMQHVVCQSPNLAVVPSIQVEISPKNFTSGFKILEFICTSYPPRLMYWSVLGSHGDLLSYNNVKYNNATVVNTNVSILQSAGWTSLRVTEVVAGGNGIKMVVCFTYDTQVKQATALLVTMEKYSTYVLIMSLLLLIIVVLGAIIILQCFKIFKRGGRETTKPVTGETAEPDTTDSYHNPAYQSFDQVSKDNISK